MGLPDAGGSASSLENSPVLMERRAPGLKESPSLMGSLGPVKPSV